MSCSASKRYISIVSDICISSKYSIVYPLVWFYLVPKVPGLYVHIQILVHIYPLEET